MKLTPKEKAGLGRALGIILKNTKSPRVKPSTLYKQLELSDVLNMDEINNIMHYIESASTEDIYNILVQFYIKPAQYRIKDRERAKQRAHEYYLKNKDKIREYKRKYAKQNYVSTKKGKKKL